MTRVESHMVFTENTASNMFLAMYSGFSEMDCVKLHFTPIPSETDKDKEILFAVMMS